MRVEEIAPAGPDLQAALTKGLVDDAAVFPPGLASLSDAATWHVEHQRSWYADMIGPLVLPASAVEALDGWAAVVEMRLPVCLTFTMGTGSIEPTLATTSAVVDVTAVEVAVPEGEAVDGLVSRITSALGGRPIEFTVEIPRDGRRDAVLAEVATSGGRAKLRTGGVRAELYPTEQELAATVLAVVHAGVAFKATAGLHHAVRNTDPDSGFEQHGFLNLLLAAEAAAAGASQHDLSLLLAERRADRVVGLVRQLGAVGIGRARRTFTSFGTCSVTEPLTDLRSLGLLTSDRSFDL